MKEGDIALLDGVLVEIKQIEHEVVPVYTEEKFLFFYRSKPTGESKLEIKRVWWQPVGTSKPDKVTSSTLSAFYRWDQMIADAKRIIKQVNILNESKTETGSD